MSTCTIYAVVIALRKIRVSVNYHYLIMLHNLSYDTINLYFILIVIKASSLWGCT